MALVDIAPDFTICTFLHPSDILTLRQTCKTLQIVTKQRTIWIEALHRVCQENKLFLPSFPIADMSDMELEQAAIAPRRWIELCASFTTQAISDPGVLKLSPTTTRITDHPLKGTEQGWDETDLILVPGGRYLVGCCPLAGRLWVWDLGYLPSADCKLIASAQSSGSLTGVQATPDGMGLVILTISSGWYLHEIYPQSETPQLVQIANIDIDYRPGVYHSRRQYLSPDKVICHIFHDSKTILRVWDYRLNASVSFMTPVDVKDANFSEVCTIQTAIIVLHIKEILIWAIPPLLPQPPDFHDNNPTRLPPRIRVKFPDGLGLYPIVPYGFRMMSSWYIDSSQPLYFDKVYALQRDRFKLVIKPDLSDATLHFINTLPVDENTFLYEFVLCEDTLVSYWVASAACGISTGSMLSHPTNTILHKDIDIWLPADTPCGSTSPICPASGRFVYMHGPYKIVVLDFLSHRGFVQETT